MTDQPPQINWEFKERFPIHDRMAEVIHLAIQASQAEVSVLRRKLEKLQYGS